MASARPGLILSLLPFRQRSTLPVPISFLDPYGLPMNVLPEVGPWWTVADEALRVHDMVLRLLAANSTERWQGERRSHERHPFPQLLTLFPVGERGLTPIAEPISVVGKHLSQQGIDFYHQEVIPYRRFVIRFDDLPWEAQMTLTVTWCRFLRPGWYDSGGRFGAVITDGVNSQE